jgi:putative ABC transport system permease protein
MNAHSKLPLAWLQLIREKVRLLVAVAGIAFACVLIFVQLGFLSALFDGAVRPHMSLNAELVMVNPQLKTLFSLKSISRRRLYQAQSVAGVSSVNFLHIGKGVWKNPIDRHTRDILIFGTNPYNLAIDLQSTELKSQTPGICSLGSAIFDMSSRPEYGPIAEMFNSHRPVQTEVNNACIKVVGLMRMGASFAADGNMVVSDTTFLRLFPNCTADQIELGLIKLKSGADRERVTDMLNRLVSPAAKVMTVEQLAEQEREYWATSSGIGFVFGLGVVVGFIVGTVIVYQILSSDVIDHLAQYATIKAIGYGDDFLLRNVLDESLILAVLGFVPGLLISCGIYQIAQAATLLPMSMPWQRIGFVFVLTCAMCAISAVIAMRKLREADPAELF